MRCQVPSRRMLPHDLPPWQTVYTYFRNWRLDGTWQSIVNALPGAVQAPVAKVGVDSLPGRKIMRQHAPLATSAQDIEDGIDNISPQVISGTPSAFDRRNQWF